MQKSKLPSLITLLILTLITVLMWIGFTIYWAVITNPEPSVSSAVSAKLTPSLDSAAINKVDSALFFNESQIPPPTPIATPVASPSATPTPTI